jgi:hypothetical protein
MSERRQIENREAPKSEREAGAASTHTPLSSGPRWVMGAIIRRADR